MRLVLAAVLVFVGLLIAVILLGGLVERSPVLGAAVIAVLFVVLCAAVMVLFNSSPQRVDDPQLSLQQLDREGLLTSVDYHARRAFEVEEFEDEGRHLFLELEDRSVLFLSGQYLYDGSLPNSDFTVKRHKIEGWVADVQCRGESLDLEETTRAFTEEDFRLGLVPEDGAVISSETYDAIKSRFMRR